MVGPRWQAVAALVDPVRRALYEYVRRQRRAVTREEAAEAQAISRSLTAFHLDKLVDSGLLRARYEAPGGQPRGRGRTPKVYEPVGDGVTVTVPPRRYELVGEILADAVATGPPVAGEAALREAYGRGRQLAAPVADVERDAGELARVAAVLTEVGFEPCADPPAGMVLANCPFHALAARQRELVCGLNHAFIEGVLDGLGCRQLTARLAPLPGGCCVEIRQSRAG